MSRGRVVRKYRYGESREREMLAEARYSEYKNGRESTEKCGVSVTKIILNEFF